MSSLKNKIFLITGASSGIGQACARQAASLGARIILAARREQQLQQLAHELQQTYGNEHLVLPMDVSNKQQVQQQLAALPAAWQTIDVLINNAGLALETLPIHQGHIEQWETMIDTNIKGLLYVTRAISPGMLARQQGHIVNIGSIAGYECYPNGNVYAASKHAVRALSKSMRMDFLGTAIRVTEIAPGAVETEFSEVRWNDKQKAQAFYQGFQPLVAEDIADAIMYCLTRPAHVDVELMVILPTAQASANHIARK